MAKAKAKPHPLQPAGLATAAVGLVLSLWSYTGDRAFSFAYFFVLLVGLVLVAAGVGAAAYGRAVAPRKRRTTPLRALDQEARDAATAPAKESRFGFLAKRRRARATADPETADPPGSAPAPSRPPMANAPPPGLLARLRGRFTRARRVPVSAPVAVDASREDAASRIRCPSCSHSFAADGPRPLVTTCPGCGLRGRLP